MTCASARAYSWVRQERRGGAYGLAAVAVLETLPPGRELAMAYAQPGSTCA